MSSTICSAKLARAAVTAACLLLPACTGPITAQQLTLAVAPSAPAFQGSSTEVYTRVARGVMACWFGPRGVLDSRLIFFARAEPEAKGGAAEILIQERLADNQRGLKMFTVAIAPRGEGAAVDAVNLKLPVPLGARMVREVHRWAKGGLGCGEELSWSPIAQAAPQSPIKPRPQSKRP